MNVQDWLDKRRAVQPMTVTEVSLAECDPWRLNDGVLTRPDGRFFQGVLSASQAWIWQPEIGILGFLVSGESGNLDVLLNLKEEPGNVLTTQIAPSIQATRSNWERVHDGPQQPYIELFLGHDPDTRQDLSVVNSEQGTRFWKKRNRNQVVGTDRALPEAQNHRWFRMQDMRVMLGKSFTVNTDARSVLASANWRSLLGNETDTRDDHDHPVMVQIRAEIQDRKASGIDPLEILRVARKNRARSAEIEFLPTYHQAVNGDGFWGTGATGFRFFHVTSRFREVAQWCQPLYSSQERLEHDLVVSEIYGSVSILLRICDEEGLYNGAEFGPSSTVGIEMKRDCSRSVSAEISAQLDDFGLTLREIEQSDEGGRFFNEVCRYRLVWVDPKQLGTSSPLGRTLNDPDYAWVTPSELNTLCGTSMATTNELRTLASLIISRPS
jgi:oxidase EvaA